MNQRTAARKTTAVLLLFAMIVGTAVFLPTAVSADDPAGIGAFSYQTLAGATLADDATDLRFLFKIDSLYYEKVGFVFSKSDASPAIGEVGCGVYETTSVYSTIYADGEPLDAGENQWWVAVKLSEIPQADFGTTFYVVGFVKEEGQDPVYSEAQQLCACAALGHNPGAYTPSDADLHARVCATCGAVLTEEHNFSMAVSDNVATYTCLDCGYSYSTDVNTVSYQETPALDKFSIQNSDTNTTVAKATYDSDGDSVDDCVRTTLTNSGSKYWLNYNNANPTYVDGKTNVISFKNDIRFASGATPTDNFDLFWFYYSFSGSASGSQDQGYGFRFREINGKIRMRAFGAESGTPNFDVSLNYDTWYSIRCDVTVTTAGLTHTLQSIRMYVNDRLVHTVNLADLNYASYSTSRVRMMIIGYSAATVTFDIRNIGTVVGAVQ